MARWPLNGRRLVRLAAAFLLVSTACLLVDGELAAQTEEPSELEAFLSAGEFGPARELAQNASTPQDRDRQLKSIARSQALAGARSASLQSLSDIRDDRVRSEALDEMLGAGGGAAMADFDSLIELITTTVEPDSWEDVGGAGTIKEFAGGVIVDADGLLRRLDMSNARRLVDVHRSSLAGRSTWVPAQDALRASSRLRKVSLNRLEREVQLRAAQGLPPDRAMRQLAGIYRIQFVLVYPESGDIVLAGPAGDWRSTGEGRVVNMETGLPVLHLDDLVVVMRNAFNDDSYFGCSIDPRPENIKRTRAYIERLAGKPIRPSQRDDWLEGLRASVGRQDVHVFGIEGNNRTARVLVEADYRMKLIGMGLEKGTAGVESYLDGIDPAEGIPSMNVLRWWFTVNYGAIKATPGGNAFEIQGQGVRVMSENQRLNEQGKRLPTGKSDELTARFAKEFTDHYEDLSIKYPVYGELRNIFDLALVSALLKKEKLMQRTGWHASYLLDPQRYQLVEDQPPTEVESVINHRVIGGKHVVAGVSGGVSVDFKPLVQADAIKTADYGLLKANHAKAVPPRLPAGRWWWD
jgi:hypothetical protein